MERILCLAEGAVSAAERMLLIAPASVEPSGPPVAATKRERNRFCVLAVVESTGELSWLVSNGYDSATCNSPAFAERVKVSLE